MEGNETADDRQAARQALAELRAQGAGVSILSLIEVDKRRAVYLFPIAGHR